MVKAFLFLVLELWMLDPTTQGQSMLILTATGRVPFCSLVIPGRLSRGEVSRPQQVVVLCFWHCHRVHLLYHIVLIMSVPT